MEGLLSTYQPTPSSSITFAHSCLVKGFTVNIALILGMFGRSKQISPSGTLQDPPGCGCESRIRDPPATIQD